MPPSSVVAVFDRAARLALRYGAPEIDIDILMVALDFEGGTTQPIDLSKVDALVTKYRRANAESPGPSSKESFGSGHSSEWIGLSSEVKAALAPFGRFEGMTVDSLRAVLLAVQNNKAKADQQA
jgi:hypothetical protein